METATRKMSFLLAVPERLLLTSIARNVPRSVTPDHMTALGVLAALGTGFSYALSGMSPTWLWLASAMIALNWLGDSLDGTLARVRNRERPRYGYYLDHIVDAFSTAAVGVGIGLSPYVDTELALLLVVAYLVLSINIYLESAVFGVFRLAYGRLGPTEVRVILILANSALAVFSPAGGMSGPILLITNSTAGLIAAAMLGLLAMRFVRNLNRLARMEPEHQT